MRNISLPTSGSFSFTNQDLHSAPIYRNHLPLRGPLRIEPFSPTPPPHEALSYIWGDLAHPNSMVVDGKDLRITRNLSCARLQLRRADRPRELWIDALCINQSNAEEKTQQVRKMHRIYSLASRVIIWLVESDSDSDLAIACLQRIRSMQFHAFMTINDDRKRHFQKLFEENVEPVSALRSRAW